jgi:SAM-dependent methyltransferase
MTQGFTEYDTRHYLTVDVVTGYSAWAHTYDQTVHDELDLHLLASLQTVPWAQCRTAVDLGCGTGRIGTWLQGQGITQLHGIDCTPAMISQAAVTQAYTQLCIADITRCPLPDQHYNMGITVLATCHVADLSAFYAEAARLLRPGGFFVLLDYHPFCLLQGIPTHFESATGMPIAIANVVHLLSDYVQQGRRVNWSLLEMQERLVDDAWIAHRPGMARYRHHPVSFVMVWQA